VKQWGQRRGWWDREDAFLLTLSDALITTNADAEAVIRARLPQLAGRLTRIPVGLNVEVVPIDRPGARRLLRRDCDWSDDATIIAFFGFLHPSKGLETLLPAFKQVHAARPHTRLLLVAGVESLALPDEQAAGYWDRLQSRIAGLGLTGLVRMTGYLPADNVSRYLSGADIGVLPFNSGTTLKNGSLLILLAHSLPMVATRHEPPDPDLEHEPAIRLVAPRDVDALATALLELPADRVASPPLRAIHAFAGDGFAWPNIGRRHLDVYLRLLEQRLPGTAGLAVTID
jgi:glycosyltransferase involved in cell wall biosynthesis